MLNAASHTSPTPVEHSGFECCSGCGKLLSLLLGLLDVLGVAVEERSAVGLGRRHRERVPVSELHPPLHDLKSQELGFSKWSEKNHSIYPLSSISTLPCRRCRWVRCRRETCSIAAPGWPRPPPAGRRWALKTDDVKLSS